jgi:hypothetical protein
MYSELMAKAKLQELYADAAQQALVREARREHTHEPITRGISSAADGAVRRLLGDSQSLRRQPHADPLLHACASGLRTRDCACA